MAEMGSAPVANTDVVKAFHMMWDNFPHGVLLLRKNREIVAANKYAAERGSVAGKKCYEIVGQTEIHARCKANQALESGVPERSTTFDKARGRVTDAYWLPVSGEADLYLHFAIYIKLPQDAPPAS